MKTLLLTLLLLVGAVALALGVVKEPGYVLIGYRNWSIETTLSLLVFATLAAFVLLYYFIRLIAGIRRMPRQVAEWERRRKSLQARNGLNRGLIELAEGRWEAAEKRLLKRVGYSDNPLLNYLAAARAAQQQGAHERRDRYLSEAHKSMPAADVAVGLTQAELQLGHRQMEQALATLMHLRSIAPRHAYVLKLLMKLYLNLRDWNHLYDLLPELRRRGVVAGAEAEQLEVRVHRELLQQAADDQDVTSLELAWKRVPRRLAGDEELRLCYADHLRRLGAGAAAESWLRKSIKRSWSPRLAHLYGQLEGADSARQLAVAEGWLPGHEKDPVLLLSLGRLAVKNRLWGKARSYFESSIGITPTLEGYRELAELLEQLGDGDAAMECYRQATLLAAPDLRLPAGELARLSMTKEPGKLPVLDSDSTQAGTGVA